MGEQQVDEGVLAHQFAGKLIGLCGYARVGKDSIQQAMGWPRAAFADELKKSVDRLFPRDTPKEIKRGTYVAYGKAMRAIQPNWWIDNLLLPYGVDRCVICDVRYPNEVAFVESHGGICFLIQRDGIEAANDEERDSIAAIVRNGIDIVRNTTIAEAAAEVLWLAGEHFECDANPNLNRSRENG